VARNTSAAASRRTRRPRPLAAATPPPEQLDAAYTTASNAAIDLVSASFGDGTQTRDFIFVGDVVDHALIATERLSYCEDFCEDSEVKSRLFGSTQDTLIRIEPPFLALNTIFDGFTKGVPAAAYLAGDDEWRRVLCSVAAVVVPRIESTFRSTGVRHTRSRLRDLNWALDWSLRELILVQFWSNGRVNQRENGSCSVNNPIPI
jgi:hypothetical protein